MFRFWSPLSHRLRSTLLRSVLVSQTDCKSNAFFWTTKTFRKIIWFLFLPFNKGFAKGWQCSITAALFSLESGCKSTDYFWNHQMFLWKNCFKTCFYFRFVGNQGIIKFEDLKICPEFYRDWSLEDWKIGYSTDFYWDWRILFERFEEYYLKILPQAPACPDLYREGCEISIVCVAECWLQTVTLCCSTDCNQRPATNGR